MKKITAILFVALGLFGITKAQTTTIPNGNFESWTTIPYELPVNYNGSNPSSYRCSPYFNLAKTNDSYHGNFAIQITTMGSANDTCLGYFLNGEGGGGNPCDWPGGIPYNQTPTGIRGYYKSDIAPGDSAGILMAFKSSLNGCVGLYMYKFYGTHSTYTPFSFTFLTPLSGTPDTLLFAAVSSDIFDDIQIPGSMFQLDSISFTGPGITQPALFNGDFEQWQSLNISLPDNWLIQTNQEGQGLSRSTDAQAGTYAIQLQTFWDKNNNGGSVARSAGISTGWWDNSCSCPRGGYPFTNQDDTLCFYYKYTPMAGDSVQVYMSFKKNGINIGNDGEFLGASATYSYMELPVHVTSVPDSVVVEFRSSLYNDTVVAFVGSTLLLDEIHFKSQALTTGISKTDAKTGIEIFPNPSSNGTFIVKNVNAFDLVRVYSVLGDEVNASIVKDGNYARIQINNSGAYLIQVNSRGKISTQRVIVTKE